MDKIYLVKCRFDGNIEGFVKEKEDINKWLIKHNKTRDYGDEEFVDEFDLIEVRSLTDNG